jgi:hypothetical protein
MQRGKESYTLFKHMLGILQCDKSHLEQSLGCAPTDNGEIFRVPAKVAPEIPPCFTFIWLQPCY